MRKSYIVAAALAAGFTLSAAGGALAADAKAKGGSIEGVWKVSHVEITGANPLSRPNPLESLYIFDHGYYAYVQVTSEKPRAAPPPVAAPGKLTDAEKIARYEEWAPFGAQAGAYALKGGKLTRTPIVSKAAGAVAEGPYDVDAKLSGDTLVLIGHAPAGQPARETKITLTRVK